MFRFRRSSVRPHRPGAVPALVAAALLLAAGVLPAQVTSHLRVEVREAGTGRPLAHAEVELPGLGRTAWTDEDGRVLLRGVPAGRHTVRARSLGYAPAETVVEVENGLTTESLVRLQPRPVALGGMEVAVDGLPAGGRAIEVEEVGPETRTLADMVERVPGVTVVRRGGPGAPAVPSIRGSSGDQVLVLVDGVALNSPLTGEADLSEVGLSAVSRVVVVPGARAGRFGPRAMAGAILIETRRPGRSGVEGSVEAGTLGRWGVEGTGTLARPGSAWSVSGGGGWERADGAFEYPVPAVRGGGVTTRENAWIRTLTGFVQAVRDPGRGPRVRLRLHARDTERGSPGTVVQPSLTGRHEQRRLGLLLQADGGGAGRSWHATAGADEHRALFADPDPPFRTAYRSESRVRQVEARVELRRSLGPVEVTVGGDARHRALEATTLADGAPREIDGAGLWLRTRWGAGDPARGSLELVGTLRGDAHDLLDGVVASPSLSLVVARRATTLEAAVGSSLSPPDISDLFFQEGVLARANPDLAPERVRGEVSLEARHRFGGDRRGGSLGLGAFRADVEGMILWFPDHRFVWSPRNVDVARRGLEVDGELRLGPLAPLRASLSWTEVAYDVPTLDGQVVYRPRLTADLGADLSLPGARVSASWRWIGSRRTRPGTDLNELPGYGRLDLGLVVPFRLPATVGSVEVGVDNVLDEHASLLVDYPLPGRTLSLRIRAGPPVP